MAILLTSLPLEVAVTARALHVVATGGLLDDNAAAGARHRLLSSHQFAELRLGQVVIADLPGIGVRFVEIFGTGFSLVNRLALDAACLDTNRAVEVDGAFPDLGPTGTVRCLTVKRILDNCFGSFE